MNVRSQFLWVLLLLVGCAADEPPDAAGSDAESVSAAPAPAASISPPAQESWTVTPAGAGDVRVGMSAAELGPRSIPRVDAALLAEGCNYLRLTGAPDSLAFMVEGGELVRIDVRGGATATAEGARIGDSEERIRSLYPTVRRQPHKYTDGAYLVALPDAPGDSLHRYVFEIDGESVTQYRAGIFPQVEWVEGCS